VPSPLPGPSGNREYFCWFRPDGGSPVGVEPADGAVAAAVAWQPAAPGTSPSAPPVLSIGGAP
jgi:23S rRNA (cytidine1920-2'-O)/16S rRNA (cytidine1409-2'-O)-methyltransferase